MLSWLATGLQIRFGSPRVASREDLGKVLVNDAGYYADTPIRMTGLLRRVLSITPDALAASDRQNQDCIERIEEARGRPAAYWGAYVKHYRRCVLDPRTPTEFVIAVRQAVKAVLLRENQDYKDLYNNQPSFPERGAARNLVAAIQSAISELDSGMRMVGNFRGGEGDEVESQCALLKSTALAVPHKLSAYYQTLVQALQAVPDERKIGVVLSRDLVPDSFSFLERYPGGRSESDADALIGGVRQAVDQLNACLNLVQRNVMKPLGMASAGAGAELLEIEASYISSRLMDLSATEQEVAAAMVSLGYKWEGKTMAAAGSLKSTREAGRSRPPTITPAAEAPPATSASSPALTLTSFRQCLESFRDALYDRIGPYTVIGRSKGELSVGSEVVVARYRALKVAATSPEGSAASDLPPHPDVRRLACELLGNLPGEDKIATRHPLTILPAVEHAIVQLDLLADAQPMRKTGSVALETVPPAVIGLPELRLALVGLAAAFKRFSASSSSDIIPDDPQRVFGDAMRQIRLALLQVPAAHSDVAVGFLDPLNMSLSSGRSIGDAITIINSLVDSIGQANVAPPLASEALQIVDAGAAERQKAAVRLIIINLIKNANLVVDEFSSSGTKDPDRLTRLASKIDSAVAELRELSGGRPDVDWSVLGDSSLVQILQAGSQEQAPDGCAAFFNNLQRIVNNLRSAYSIVPSS